MTEVIALKKILCLILALTLALSVSQSFCAFAAESDYSVKNLDDTTVEITRYKGSDNSVLVPASIGGKAVVSIGQMAFMFTEVTNVTLPVSLKALKVSAFDTAYSLINITLNEGLETIGDSAFDNCEMLQKISIPSTVTSIGSNVFASDYNMNTITVAEGNKNYYADGKALYNIEKTRLMKYVASCNGESYVVPYTVTTLDTYAFSHLKKLKTLQIPVSVVEIGDYAFYESSSLTDIYYGGTADQWAAISKGSNNDILNSVNIHYNEYPGCDEHSWDGGTTTTEPNCEEDGEETYTCYICGHTKTEPVNKLGHDFGEWTETKAPTCTEDGEETRYCSRCPYKETRPIDSAGAHSWNDGEVTVIPTCVKDGEKTFTCTSCGFTKTEAVPATGNHTAVVDKAVPATFSKSGLTKGSHCSICNEIIIPQKTVAKLGKPHIKKLSMGNSGLTVKWNKVKRVHGFYIQISTSRKFAKNKTKTYTVKNQKLIKRTFKKYKKGKYYVRIKAYKVIGGKKQTSEWSKSKKINR